MVLKHLFNGLIAINKKEAWYIVIMSSPKAIGFIQNAAKMITKNEIIYLFYEKTIGNDKLEKLPENAYVDATISIIMIPMGEKMVWNK